VPLPGGMGEKQKPKHLSVLTTVTANLGGAENNFAEVHVSLYGPTSKDQASRVCCEPGRKRYAGK